MITDLRAVPASVDLAADVCIVGSGPAGLTLAAQFAGTKHQVVVLEAGGLNREEATQTLYEGQVLGRRYPIESSRLRVCGGTSGHWTGQCGTPLARHMRRRPGVTDSHWPINAEDLSPYYLKASRLLELGQVDQDDARPPI